MEIIIPILRIASILCTCNGNNTWYLCDLQENKDALVIAMDELKDIRDDVKRKVVEAENNPNGPMECNKEVSRWLERVQAIEGDVVQVLLKADKEIKGRCFGGYCSINCWSRYKIGKLVTQTLTIVKDSRTKGTFGDVAYKLPPSLVEKQAVELTVGMESMFDKVLRLLGEDEVRIMGLYGQGGVGKTTLLKQINNAFEPFLQSTTASSSSTTTTTTTPHGFDVVILVVVSKVINIKDIQKEIGDRLGLSSPNEKNIRKALSKKNFVLLLDDIWERVDLPSIGIPSSHENTKSKVVFTTRSETVCGDMEANEMFEVECLPWNEAWSLFQEKVGERALNSFPRARELAEAVARECGGLPRALITIGRAMSTKKSLQEWNDAITTSGRSASEILGMVDLKLISYDSLPNNIIKSCFLYCALFPEDHCINKIKLIDYWIGEGLISLNEFDHIDEARNYGYNVIGDLKGAGLLEDGVDEETEVKMRDTIRDLALWIAHDQCGGSKRDKICIIEMLSDLTAERSSRAERIYLILPPNKNNNNNNNNNNKEIMVVGSPLNSPNLITLIYANTSWYNRQLSVLPQNFFRSTSHLRVLDLTLSHIETLPASITDLLELRYLNLSKTPIGELPGELGKLLKLKHLDLSDMIQLRTIPSGVIGSLLELRVLNLFGCTGSVIGWDIEEVYKLKHLNDFGITIQNSSTLNKLLSNQNLQKCTRHLSLVVFDKQTEDVKPPAAESTSLSSSSTIITLEKLLHLLSNLETLRVFDSFLLGSSSSSCCFQNLIQIEIIQCNELKDLTWVGYVPNLKALAVSICEELEEIVIVVDDDFGGSTGGGGEEISIVMNNVEDVFKRLETLFMYKLPKLKSICKNALAFPCLRKLAARACPQLKRLRFDSSGSNLGNTLQMIQGEEEWWNELRWEDDDDNNELVKSKFLPYFHKYVV